MGKATFDFSGEVVLVTGGSRGLGFEIAQAFGAAGAIVVITARREPWLHEELAPAVLFLASDAASYITGQVLPVDGGKTAQ